jgi:DNA topoisomerase-1
VSATLDPVDAAAAAGLVHVSDDAPGIRRIRCGRGFRYLLPDGGAPDQATRDRIAALVVPPAWTDVWICLDPDGHVQATGRDAAGRKQARYHDRWREARDAEKFASLPAFGRALTEVRARVAADLSRRGLPRERVLALVVRLLDETLIRVGNPEYARRESFGLTTLESRHVEVEGGALVFEFTGKSLVEHRVEVTDARLARLVAACDEDGGHQLFTYRHRGQLRDLCSDDVNGYLRDIAGPGVTAKDFRTWGGTVTALEHLAGAPQGDPAALLAAIDAAAERLGNTRDVCRRAYVHPELEPAHADGRLQAAWRASRRTARLRRSERATLRLLEAPVAA